MADTFSQAVRLPVLINLETSEKFEIKQSPVSIGRAPNNDIVLSDGFTSGYHARLFWEEGAWWLEDLQSSNGTSLNGEIIIDPVKLTPGNTIKVGHTNFRIE